MIIEYISSHQTEFWLAMGFVLLVIEALTGFSVGILLFTGLGALTTGLLMSLSLVPETWVFGISCTGISSGVITALLWKPFKKLQGDDGPAKKDNTSDLIGHQFVLESDLSPTQSASTHYSGIHWKVALANSKANPIEAGEKVVVSSVEVGLFKVKLAK